MSLTQVTGPYPIFTDLDGSPLDDGYLYIGDQNDDPETNPIQVYWDSALTIPATQPIRTNSGYAWRNGTPGLLYTAGAFSITIRNKRNEFVLYSPVGYGFDPAAVSASVVKNDFTGDGVEVDFTLSAAPSTILATNVFINGVYQEKDSYSILGNVLTFSIAPPLNSSIEVMTNETGVINSGNATAISYTLTAPGAVAQTVQSKLDQYLSLKDFGAVGDGVTDDATAFTDACAAAMSAGAALLIPAGTYNLGAWASPIITTGKLSLVGEGIGLTTIVAASPSGSLFRVLHDANAEGIAFSGFTANTSANGGSIFYNLDSTDSGISPVRVRVENCRFYNCKAPINIESPHNNCLVADSLFDTIVGHPLRFGTASAVAKWPTWKNTHIDNNSFTNVTAVGSGQNVYGILFYGTDTLVRDCVFDGVTGNGAEAGGIYATGTGYQVLNNTVKNVTTGTVVRSIILKGEQDAKNVLCDGNLIYCDNAALSEGIAAYFKSGFVTNNQVLDPAQIGINLGSSCSRTQVTVSQNRLVGSNVVGVSGIGATHDSGNLTLKDNDINAFVKPVTIDVRTGADRLVIDERISGSLGTGIDVYLTNNLPELEIGGEIEITGSSYCILTRGPGTLASASINPKLLKTVGGFGWRNEAATTEVNAYIPGVTGVTTAGREVSFTVLPQRGNIRIKHAYTLTNSSATNMLSLPIADDTCVAITFAVTANLTTSSNAYIRRAKASASGGTASIGSVQDVWTDEDAAGWDATIAVSGANALPQVTGASGVKLNMLTEIQLTN